MPAHKLVTLLLLLSFHAGVAQKKGSIASTKIITPTATVSGGGGPRVVTVVTGSTASFRGLSVVSDSVVWVSGTQGTVGLSLNGGRTWQFTQVPRFEQTDFRDIEGFDSNTAVIVAASTPAIMLRTSDGGKTWRETYHNNDPKAFFDAFDFFNDREGLAFSDPLNGRMLLAETRNGGASWQNLPVHMCPALADSEAGFAASGTVLRCLKSGHVFVATGGKVSRLFTSADKGRTWSMYATPMRQGRPSQGIFSVAMANPMQGIIVGGDYQAENDTAANAFYTSDGGRTWKRCLKPPGGYRSCVEVLDKKTAICTGPGGTELSPDMGRTWQPVATTSTGGYHTCRKAKTGNSVFLSGANGRIAKLEWPAKPKANPAAKPSPGKKN